jgi:hypothetical protein
MTRDLFGTPRPSTNASATLTLSQLAEGLHTSPDRILAAVQRGEFPAPIRGTGASSV